MLNAFCSNDEIPDELTEERNRFPNQTFELYFDLNCKLLSSTSKKNETISLQSIIILFFLLKLQTHTVYLFIEGLCKY